jgi:hypothetical protein
MGQPLTYEGQPLTYLGEPLVFGSDLPPPGLGPLLRSHEADDVEAEFKSAVIEVFERVLRPALARIETYGMPHRGEFSVMERFVKSEGLALERQVDAEPFMRELYRAWRARNPRRGLHLLRFYLQVLWPDKWTMQQLWHMEGEAYPYGVVESEVPGSFLTSRVRVFIDLGSDDGTVLSKVIGSLRSVTAARLVLEASIQELATTDLEMAGVADQGDEAEEFVCTMGLALV